MNLSESLLKGKLSCAISIRDKHARTLSGIDPSVSPRRHALVAGKLEQAKADVERHASALDDFYGATHG